MNAHQQKYYGLDLPDLIAVSLVAVMQKKQYGGVYFSVYSIEFHSSTVTF